MTRVLLAGESWISTATHVKGFDEFSSTTFHTGADAFIAAAAGEGLEVEQMYAHDVPGSFPRTVEALSAYDVVILSDIGANSFLLPPETWLTGQKAANPLAALAEWTRRGGGLMMAGGYLSFQGFQGRANYHRTAVEDVLPVRISPFDDRVETPEGVAGRLTDVAHPITDGLDTQWPIMLGHQRLEAREDATVLATIEDNPLLLVREVGEGRTLAFASDISPHWAPQEFMGWDGYGVLFDRAVRWLARDLATASTDENAA